jgi:tetratricopeptide (TPR) repeat protein
LSVYEESVAFAHWRRNDERIFVDALEADSLCSLGEMERQFSKPRGPGGLPLAYYHAGLVVEFIIKKYGFEKILAMIDGYAAGKVDADIFKDCLNASTEELDKAFMQWVKERFGKYKIAGRISALNVGLLKDEAELNAKSSAAWARLSRAYLTAGKILDCESSLKRAQKLDPSEPELLVAQAQLDIHQGFLSAAKEHYLKAIAEGLKKPFDVHVILARLYIAENKHDEAIEHLNKAAEGFPYDVSAVSPYRILYGIYNSKEEKDKANEQLKKIVALTDKDLQARIALADKYLLDHDYVDAGNLLWDVVYMNPLLQGVHERLGDALYGQEDIEGAMAEFKRAIVVGGRDVHTAYAGLAQCYFDKENMKLAEENAKKALELNPQNQRAREVLELLDKWSE